jgi:phosphomannomutase/phosphoglucomutase
VRQVQDRLALCLKTREALGPSKSVLRDVITIDGVRAIFDDGWGLIRASNTQPALVLRFEATSTERLAAIRAVIEGELRAAQQTLGC